MKKAPLCINAKTKAHISFAVTAQLISAFVFATYIEQSLDQHHTPTIASLLLSSMPGCAASFVSVGPGRKPRRHFFSRRGSCLLLCVQKCTNKDRNSTVSRLNECPS